MENSHENYKKNKKKCFTTLRLEKLFPIFLASSSSVSYSFSPEKCVLQKILKNLCWSEIFLIKFPFTFHVNIEIIQLGLFLISCCISSYCSTVFPRLSVIMPAISQVSVGERFNRHKGYTSSHDGSGCAAETGRADMKGMKTAGERGKVNPMNMTNWNF